MWNNVYSAEAESPHPLCYAHLHLDVPSAPLHFTVMTLISKFKLLLQEHKCALTVIDMLMNYTWCVLLCIKKAAKVVYANLVNVYSKFDVLHKILLSIWKVLSETELYFWF